MKSRLRVLPLGGLGEIGKNMAVIEFDERIVVIDAGVRFPTPEMHGIDLVIPDVGYLMERRERIEGVVLTHGHEDHLGALPWVLRQLGPKNVPAVFGRRLTAAMARSKLDEHKIETPVIELPTGTRKQLGPFEIELIHMTHSIPDAAAVAIRTELGAVLFTGDYRFDQTPVDGRPADTAALARLGEDGLLLLCGDSTNADRPGFARSESEIGPELLDVFARCEGRIILTSFASNIHRVQQAIDAAASLDRRVSLIGRSMVKNVRIARDLGHVVAPDSIFVDPRSISKVADEDLVILTTGSQGEPLAALRRMAHGEHKQVSLHEGDTIVFSATPVPGNERAINETVDRLFHLGCDVITAADAPIHTSGHGHREELKLMLNLTRPKYVMPVHGDYKRIRLHAELAADVGVDEANIFKGDIGIPLDITEDGASLSDAVQSGIAYVDGLDIGEPTESALHDRSAISTDGIIFVVATISAKGADTLADHEIVLRGVPLAEDEGKLVGRIRSIVEDALDDAAAHDNHEVDLIEKEIRDRVAQFIYSRLKRRPMVVPVVVEI